MKIMNTITLVFLVIFALWLLNEVGGFDDADVRVLNPHAPQP